MLVLGFDTETTGLDTAKDFIIQIGAVLWETGATHKPAKRKLDVLIYDEDLPEMSPDALATHQISVEDLKQYGVPFKDALKDLWDMAEQAEWIVAHNGNQFDKPILESNIARRAPKAPQLAQPWIDTSCDIEFPPGITTRKLSYLATEHGFINPFPHDAISDVMTMLQVAQRYDWKETVRYAKAPTLVVKAETTYAQKELAKKQNYRWDGNTKSWTKSVKDFQLEETKRQALDAGFKVTVLKK